MLKPINTPARPDFIDNKVVFLDGLVGGGKSMISQIISALPSVEMWKHSPKIEQICGLYHLGHISMEGTVTLLKNWFDTEAYNVSMLRDINCRPTDLSSIFKYPRKWSYILRFFQEGGEGALQKFIKNGRILNFMTHALTGYSLPLFETLKNRLTYIRFVRCPMTEYLHIHLARWSTRWGTDLRGGTLLFNYKNNTDTNNCLPYFVSRIAKEYLHASPYERTIYILEQWQVEGNRVIDNINKKYSSQVLEIPYEKFVLEPMPYIEKIATAIDVNVDKITKKEMRLQKVPRRSLTDAPKNKVYAKLGWKPPEKHCTIEEEYNLSREKIKTKISKKYLKKLDLLSTEYIERYKIF